MSKIQLNFRVSFCRDGRKVNLIDHVRIEGAKSESAFGQGVDRERAEALDGGEGLRRGVPRHQPRRELQAGRRHSRASIPERSV